MSRRVPEAAVLVGVVLSLSFGMFGALFGDPLSTALVSTLLLYVFVGYAVRVDDDPAGTLPPGPVLAAAAVAAGLVLAYGLVAGRPFTGLVVALVLVVPTALYHAQHTRAGGPLSPDATLLAAGVAAALVLTAGVVGWRLGLVSAGGVQLAGLAAGVLGVGGGEYHSRRGGRLDRRTEQAAVALALLTGLLALGYFIAVDAAMTGVVVGTALLLVGAYFSLVDERRARGRRRRRRG